MFRTTAWMPVDPALSTGLKGNEIAALQIKHVDLKRVCRRVAPLGRNKKAGEALALGEDIARHLKRPRRPDGTEYRPPCFSARTDYNFCA